MRRLCEAPVSPRYVQCYRCEAIQCREDNIRPTSYVPTYLRLLRQPWIASPHIINYVSQVRRRLRKDGQGEALPCPGAMRRDGGRGCAAHGAGIPPRRYAPPLPRGEFTGEASAIRNPSPSVHPLLPIPLLVGVPPQRGGGFPRRARRNPRPNLSSLIFDI
ncbi:MAG: hypothetical protein LBM98_13455 [Oscillospiraceae bacterium]|nr:hypothetical protein [Oscillospiraceae bacterium]